MKTSNAPTDPRPFTIAAGPLMEALDGLSQIEMQVSLESLFSLTEVYVDSTVAPLGSEFQTAVDVLGGDLKINDAAAIVLTEIVSVEVGGMSRDDRDVDRISTVIRGRADVRPDGWDTVPAVPVRLVLRLTPGTHSRLTDALVDHGLATDDDIGFRP